MSEGLHVLRGARRPEMPVPQASSEAVRYEEQTLRLNEETISSLYTGKVQGVLDQLQLRVLKNKLDEAHQREVLLQEEARRAKEEAQRAEEGKRKAEEAARRHKEESEKNREASLRDGLTGLPNRIAFRESLDQRMERARMSKYGRLAVFYIDLDNFKQINDTYGHQAGDLLLKNISAHVGKALRPDDMLARLGGDEFAALCFIRQPREQLPSAGDARTLVERGGKLTFAPEAAFSFENETAKIAERVRAAVTNAKRELFESLGQADAPELADTASVGSVFYEPARDTDMDSLVQRADAHMYEVKRGGKSKGAEESESPIAAHERERAPQEAGGDHSCDVEMPDTAVPGIVPGH
ncbi:MAG TPA: diguanylate cyclase [Candidatus Paceibacterota bacterium]